MLGFLKLSSHVLLGFWSTLFKYFTFERFSEMYIGLRFNLGARVPYISFETCQEVKTRQASSYLRH